MDISTKLMQPDLGAMNNDKARQIMKQASDNTGPSAKQRQQAKKVAQDFEAMVVGMMMKSMRDTVGKDKLTGGGHGEEVYRSMLDQEYATASVKRGGGMGLARMIEKDIIRQETRKSGQLVNKTE